MYALKKKRLYALLLICCLSGGAVCVRAQESGSHEAVQDFLLKMQKAYKDAAYLSFRVQYLYANAGDLGRRLDSIAGEVEMDKGRSRFVIDGTETLVTEKYAIRVMEEGKLIYLSKPGNAAMMDPVSLLDSVIAHKKGTSVSVATEGGDRVLTINLPPGQSYSRVRMSIDPATGWLRRMEYDVQTEGLVGQDLVAKNGRSGPYEAEGRVTILFSQYKKGAFGDALFSETKFFTRTAEGFEPAGAYKDYRIFLASSNL